MAAVAKTNGKHNGEAPRRPKVKRKLVNLIKWDDRYYVEAYVLAQGGMPDSDIADHLGVSPNTFKRWKAERPALAHALKKARHSLELTGYVYERLPIETQRLFERLQDANRKKEPLEVIEGILSGAGVPTRKRLFLHALTQFHFNSSRACHFVNIPQKQLAQWLKSDPEFAESVQEMEWHKNNLYESELVTSVKMGDTPAITFANKTRNADRGYVVKKTVELTGTVSHAHLHFVSLDDLDLPVNVLDKMLRQIDKKNERNTIHLQRIGNGEQPE